MRILQEKKTLARFYQYSDLLQDHHTEYGQMKYKQLTLSLLCHCPVLHCSWKELEKLSHFEIWYKELFDTIIFWFIIVSCSAKRIIQ